MIYQKLRDYRRACREMQQAVKLDATNPQVGACCMGGPVRWGLPRRWVYCLTPTDRATAMQG